MTKLPKLPKLPEHVQIIELSLFRMWQIKVHNGAMTVAYFQRDGDRLILDPRLGASWKYLHQNYGITREAVQTTIEEGRCKVL